MKINKFPDKITEDLAEEIGWHIGDGSMNYYLSKGYKRGIYQLRGHIEDDKAHYIQRIKPIFKEIYGIDISLREMPSTRVFGFQIWGKDLVKFKQSLGLKVGPKIDIVIPDKFLTEDRFKIGIIRGIFDTDGCVYLEKRKTGFYPRLEIKTISLQLAKQLKSIFISLNLRATMYEEKRRLYGNQKICYAVIIRGKEMFHNFVKIINPKNPKHLAKYNRFTQSFK